MLKKYKIITYGCQMNVHESEKLAGVLKENGYVETNDDFDADIIVLNTCCIRESAETHVLGNLGAIKTIKEKNRSLKVVVCGCMSQEKNMAEKLKKRCQFIDLIFGTHNLHKFSEYLKEINAGKKIVDVWDSEVAIVENLPIKRSSGVNAWVNIMYGCNNFCSYCIVPYVRGRERSRSANLIISDVENLVKEGYKEITLLGQNVNSYGNDLKDNPISFAELLRKLAAIEGEFRIKFLTSHPKDLSIDVIKAIAENEKLAKFFHIPIQSGSNNILKAMNRKYTVEDYLSRVNMIREYIPNAGVSGDVMVGFPGETEQDVEDTIDLIKKVRYNNLYTFIYSKRVGTPAALMENQIDTKTKSARIERIIAEQFIIANQIAAEAIGKEYRVLCYDYKNGVAIGKTTCDRSISFNCSENIKGQYVDVIVIKNKNSKLVGKIKI